MRGLGRRGFLVGTGGLALAGFASRLSATDVALPEPAAIGIKAAREWAARPEVTPYDIGIAHAPHYAEAAMALGVARLSKAVPDFQLMELVGQRWEKARPIPNSRNHVDANVIGLWPMLLGDPDGEGLAMADEQWADTDENGLTKQARFWIDDLWMIGALLAQAWRETSDPRFIARSAITAKAYLERLQQPNGLFFHGPDAPFHWGRGNGWVAAGLAEVFSILPHSHPDWTMINAGYRRMMDALIEHQAESGMWRQLVDNPDAWEESSGTAMFAFAMLRGVKSGLLPADPFAGAADRAWQALAARVDGVGLLADICVGTGQSRDMQFYLDRPRVTGDLHGQATLLWLAAEMLV